MLPLSLIALAIVLAPLVLLYIPLYVWLRRTRRGTLRLTTPECEYDSVRFGNTLSWDEHCLYINGQPTLLFASDFCYWRVPCRSQWEPILKQYRSAGLNCVRVPLHWGFHSPEDGVYRFDGNADVEFLLALCERLELFVLAAPGPYIGLEAR